MQFVDEFRQDHDVKKCLHHIAQLADKISHKPSRPYHIMEVCGGHTHAIFHYGLDKLLPDSLEFIHGPGCPVCVLPRERIDLCQQIASQTDIIFCTFGDALRVPGTHGSLLDTRRLGADIRLVYSPLDALTLAKKHPDKKVVFFALGFETTMPATALTVQLAEKENIQNFFLFCQHITIIPTLKQLLEQPDNQIDALLAPGHVSMVIGSRPYGFICKELHKPLVISGFEPLDILLSVATLLAQQIRIEQAPDTKLNVENRYRRVVCDDGNPAAQQAMMEVFELKQASNWRGLGMIPHSGMQLSPKYQRFDILNLFNLNADYVPDLPESRCGDVLTGRCKPKDCPCLGKSCTPHSPLGALMVSSEGACAAWYQYRLYEGKQA